MGQSKKKSKILRKEETQEMLNNDTETDTVDASLPDRDVQEESQGNVNESIFS